MRDSFRGSLFPLIPFSRENGGLNVSFSADSWKMVFYLGLDLLSTEYTFSMENENRGKR